MLSERQSFEASPIPATDRAMPPPPLYSGSDDLFAPQSYPGPIDGPGYFLGEVPGVSLSSYFSYM